MGAPCLFFGAFLLASLDAIFYLLFDIFRFNTGIQVD